MSTLIGIAIKSKKRAPMQLLERAEITKAQGVADDFRGKPGKRQVTVLCKKSWSQACLELNKNPGWLTRRANLLVDDIELYQSKGKMIKIGEVSLLITGETDPCSRMNEAEPGLFDVLIKNWRGGVCCKVISDGEISLNDKVLLVD